jgi:3-methyladenine DNA glycosylase AlkD
VVRQWARDEDLWVRRTAILCQRASKAATDTDLLADVLTARRSGGRCASTPRTDPDWVLAYVDARAGELSGLSRRAALEHLTPPGCGDPVGPARS